MESVAVNTSARPRLVYDGDCGFCGYWARYWHGLTGDSVDYKPYQQVAAQYPAIPVAAFQRAVQYIAPDGHHASAAEASFLTLSHAPGKGIWLALYRKLPGFAPAAERAYAFTAAHRAAFFRLSLLLWGRNYAPPRYDVASYLFLRLFGLIYLSAFVSFGVQAQGLIGSHGILPLTELVDALGSRFGAERFFLMPMAFWCNSSDFAIQAVCWLGAGLSVLLVLNLLPRLSLLLLYVLYLSLLYAGQEFMTYQWKFNLGLELATVGELDQAIELTRQALATDPLRGTWYAALAFHLSDSTASMRPSGRSARPSSCSPLRRTFTAYSRSSRSSVATHRRRSPLRNRSFPDRGRTTRWPSHGRSALTAARPTRRSGR
ncbi:MAG: DCC1-like thiol-disulfide oxidoreductase family protein [Steroidobacteraceae bacterium]